MTDIAKTGELVAGESAANNDAQSMGASILAVISAAAANPDVDVDKMERLLNIQERVLEKEAEKSCAAALCHFQRECPQIERRSEGSRTKGGNVVSHYAKFEDMMEVTRPLQHKYGFADTYDSHVNDIGVISSVTCRITHQDGHSWTATVPVFPDKGGLKSGNQEIGGAITYGKRYAFAEAMGIVFRDMDNDGAAPKTDSGPGLKQDEWKQGNTTNRPDTTHNTPPAEPTDDEEMTMWLKDHQFTMAQLDAAVNTLTKGEFSQWSDMPEERKAAALVSESLARIEAAIRKGAKA